MTSSSNVEDLLRKLARPTQKVGKTRVKLAWRRRESSKRGIKLTDTERQELKDKREEKHVKLEDALNTARDTMYKMAEEMSEEFGKAHRPKYYYSLIMQQSKLKIKPQKFSCWNVFVSRETRKRNDGAYQRCFCVLPLILIGSRLCRARHGEQEARVRWLHQGVISALARDVGGRAGRGHRRWY